MMKRIDTNKKYAHDFINKGGTWLGNLRTRIQTMFRNGDDVTWGSEDRMSHIPTIRELEELGSYAVMGMYDEEVLPLMKLLEKAYDELEKHNADEELLNKIFYQLYKAPRWLSKYDAIQKK